MNKFLVFARWIDGELHIKIDSGWIPVAVYADDMVSTPVVTMTKAGFPSMSKSGISVYNESKEK